jgi:nicotinamidase-related amidase
MKPALIIIDIQNDYLPGGIMEPDGSAQAGLQPEKPAQVRAAPAAEFGVQS